MQATTKHNGHNGHHRPEILEKTPQEINDEILGLSSRSGTKFFVAVVALVVLTVLGIVGFFLRLGDGFGVHTHWAYLAAVFAFILTTSLSAPLVAIAPRLARAHFNRPITRAAELWSVAGLVSLVILVPLLIALPSASGRRTFWFVDLYREGWPAGAPHVYLAPAVVFLVATGLALLWVGAIPDFAVARDRTGRRIYHRLAMGWQGTAAEWRRLRTFISLLGAFYFVWLVWTHTLVSFDFAQSLVPGYKDSIFPAHHALSGIQSALATTLVTMFVLRTFGGMKEYIGVEQFWGLSKLLLASSLLWAYFWWSGFIIFWYGRAPVEQNILHLFMTGPYRPLFMATFAMNFLTPLFLFIWSPVRRSIIGPTALACVILVGTFIDRIRIYTASFSVGVPGQEGKLSLYGAPEEFQASLSAMTPDLADVLMVAGALSAAVLTYLLATRIVPMVNMWGSKEGVLLQRVRPLVKHELKVLAKPD